MTPGNAHPIGYSPYPFCAAASGVPSKDPASISCRPGSTWIGSRRYCDIGAAVSWVRTIVDA